MVHPASRPLAVSLLLAGLLAPAAARANAFALDLQGLFSNGTASAGAAAARDPAGQFANPAVLASLEGTRLVLGGMLIAPNAPYTDAGSTLLDGGMALPGKNGDGGQTGGAPWLFASHRLSPELAVGLALTAPFGTSSDYGKASGFYGRYQGVESRIESWAFGPSVAWRPTGKLALGLAVAARRDRAVIGQAFDLGSICVAQAAGGGDPDPVATCAGLGLVPGESDGYGKFEADGWSWTATVGLTFEPAPGTQLGLGYRREAKGKVKGDEALDLATAGLLGVLPTASASMELPLPDFATLSLSQRLGEALTLHAAVQLSLWKRLDTLELVPDDAGAGLALEAKQGYRNTVRAAVGAAFAVSPGVELFAGAAFEQSPITDEVRQVPLPERDSLLVGAGGEVSLGRLTFGAVYQRVQMLGDSKIDQAGATGDRVVGAVKGSANLAVVQLGWRG